MVESHKLSKKRPRTDSLASKDEVVRHEYLWFEDGSIVLVADDTQFRVHKSILACESSVFQDMFTVAQPDDMETVEGCSVLRLTDSAEDLGYVLRALYHGLRYKNGEMPTWFTLRAFLRLGDKYALEEIYAEAMHHLNNLAFRTVQDSNTFYYGDSSTSCISDAHLDPWEVVDIANNTKDPDLQRIHIGALYCCCQIPLKKLLYGVKDSNGARVKLCSEDLLSCLVARERLHVVLCEALDKAPCDALSSDCQSLNACRDARDAIVSCMRIWDRELEHHPLGMDKGFLKDISEQSQMCTLCTQLLLVQYAAACQKILDHLPAFFKSDGNAEAQWKLSTEQY